MHGTGPFTPKGLRCRMGYDPKRVSTDACKWSFTRSVNTGHAQRIYIDMSKDPAKAQGASADRVYPRLLFTRQPGRINRDGEDWAHPHLLCVDYFDPDEGHVELFAMAQNAMNKRHGPRGYPSRETRQPTFGNEMEHKALTWEFGVGARRGYPLWRQWLGRQGEHKGWYRETERLNLDDL